MKKLIKKPVLLLGTLGALIGLGFVSTQSADVNAQGSVKWCDYIVDEQTDEASCSDPMTTVPCI